MKAIVPAWRVNSLNQNWFNEFDQLFENMMRPLSVEGRWNVACDVEESEKFLLFSFDLPGLEESDFKVEVDGPILKISGERQAKSFDETGSRSWRGRHYGRFVQSFKLPQSIDVEGIEADYTNGVLKVLLPKNAKEVAKKIEVTAKKDGLLKQLFKAKTQTEG